MELTLPKIEKIGGMGLSGRKVNDSFPTVSEGSLRHNEPLDVPVCSSEERFRLECEFGNYWHINATESQESKHDHQGMNADGEEKRSKGSALESFYPEHQKAKAESRRKIERGASRKTAGHGEPASREREWSAVSDAARRAHVTRTENWPLDLG